MVKKNFKSYSPCSKVYSLKQVGGEILNLCCDLQKQDIGLSLLHLWYELQSTLVISKLKGPSETLQDIRTSTYQIFRIEENTNCTTKFHK